MNSDGKTILGVDPGIGTTGWAVVVEGPTDTQLLSHGCIRPPRKEPTAQRLHRIFAGIGGLCGDFSPGVIALEASFYGKNVKSALVIGQVRAAVMLAAAEAKIPIYEYPARLVKQAVTGQGQAGKSQVGYMVKNLLSLAEPITPEDAADAAAIALCHILRRDNIVATVNGKS